MKASQRGVALRKLLDLCSDMQQIRTRLTDPALSRDARTRLRRQARAKHDRLARDLQRYRFKGPLRQLLREFRLELVHFQILAALLRHHLRAETPAMEGRELLGSVFDDPVDVLAGMELLHDNSVLRASGLVVPADEDESAGDVLEARFRISDDALRAFRDELAGLVVEDRRARPDGYAGNHELLLDLRILHNLYKHRSERAFCLERWDRVHAGPPAPVRPLTQRIERFTARIQRRLQNTPEAERFPAVRFFAEHGLDQREQIVVVHLLFKELYEGNAYADAAELVRLVSAEELDLVRNRRLLLESGRLMTQDIVRNETLLEGRELTGEVYLSDWAVNYLFGAPRAEEAIDTDDRLDWHLYLKGLRDTKPFFRDLEAN
jgi:hypothetical protein